MLMVGTRIINLNNVTQIYARDFDTRQCIQVDFNKDTYERFYVGSAEYDHLDVWMREQTHISRYADVYERIANALEMLERR